MGSNEDFKNSLQRKELEQELAILQFAVVMRQRTGQPDSELDRQAIQRVNNLLAKLSIGSVAEAHSNPDFPSPNGGSK